VTEGSNEVRAGPVEGVLLVGGLGTRLRPLTVYTPKPMLPVAGVPFVLHQLARLRDAGVTHVVLATSYRAEVFEGYLGDGTAFGLELEFVTEDDPMGTGGAIRNVVDRLRSGPDDPVVVLNGDVLSGHDIGGQVAWHRRTGADVTLHLVRVADPRAYGSVLTDASGRVTRFLEKTPEPVTDQVNAGCYVFRRSVLDAIPSGRAVSVERETFPGLLERGALLLGCVDDAYWLDLGTPEAFVTGSRDLVLGVVRSSAVPGPPGPSLVLGGAVVEPGAVVDGGSVVGAGAHVAAGAQVHGSVLQDGAVVGTGARIFSSVVGSGASVGERTVVQGAVLGDDSRVGADCQIAAGTRIWVGVTLPDRSVRTSDDDAG
jgi:mannose-1-phosphate guanylyltransferase